MSCNQMAFVATQCKTVKAVMMPCPMRLQPGCTQTGKVKACSFTGFAANHGEMVHGDHGT